MKYKVFALVAMLAIALFVAGCGEKAGQATKNMGVSAISPVEFTNLQNENNALRADVENLKNLVSFSNNKYDSLKADVDKLKVENNALKNNVVNVDKRLDILKVKAGVTGTDITNWDKYPITLNNPITGVKV